MAIVSGFGGILPVQYGIFRKDTCSAFSIESGSNRSGGDNEKTTTEGVRRLVRVGRQSDAPMRPFAHDVDWANFRPRQHYRRLAARSTRTAAKVGPLIHTTLGRSRHQARIASEITSIAATVQANPRAR